jgi:hypothetical protein
MKAKCLYPFDSTDLFLLNSDFENIKTRNFYLQYYHVVSDIKETTIKELWWIFDKLVSIKQKKKETEKNNLERQGPIHWQKQY